LRGRAFASTSRELPGRYLFLPFQVDHDTQILHNSPWIRGMRHLFAEAESALDACGDPALHLVFREHPSTRALYPELHDRARAHGRLHFVNDRPLAEVIERSLAVATINSTVGVESLLLGRKVVTLGDAFYNIPGLVLHAPSRDAFRRAVAGGLERFEPEEPLRRGFLAWLQREYVVPGSWRRPDDAHWEAAGRRVRELSGLSPSPAGAEP
jgi:capsular polysaccharide export protein